MTSFPKGFLAGLSVRRMPLLQTHPGNISWVDNGAPSILPNVTSAGADGNPGTLQRPLASIAGALLRCQQGNGDIILVKPGHREEITGAGLTTQPAGAAGTSIALNVAGVAILGLGQGAQRPTLTFSTAAAANIPVQAMGMSLQNFRLLANFADIASMFSGASASSTTSTIAGTTMTTGTTTGTWYPGMHVMGTGVLKGTIVVQQLTGVTGGAGTYQVSVSQTVASTTITGGQSDFNIEACVVEDYSSVLNALTIFTGAGIANGMDRFRFAGNRISSLGTTAATTAIKSGNFASDGVEITDNFLNYAILNDTACLFAGGSGNHTSFQLLRNIGYKPNTSSTGGSFVSGSGTAWTGMAADNYFWQLVAATGIWIPTGTKLGFQNNYSPITGAADKSGLINPAAV